MPNNAGQVIPFTRAQVRALKELAAEQNVSVPVVIQKIVGDYLKIVMQRPVPRTPRMPKHVM